MINAIKVRIKQIKLSIIHIIKKIIPTPGIFIDQYYVENNAEVVLYTKDSLDSTPFSHYQPQKSLKPSDINQSSLKVSLISTLKNEADNVKAWANSVFKQIRLPDEIIIVDAGSTDGTLGLLKEVSTHSPVPFHVIIEPGVNIAQGRNIAITKAQFDVIATTDFGCRLHTDWLEKLLAPFELEPGIDVSAGMYQAVDRKGKNLDRMAWWTNHTILDLKWFLPSGRSSAFTKTIWKIVGGYPEWFSMTGEDTFFALELKKYAKKWAFVPEAIVDWIAPDTTLPYWRKIYNWSIGDGESGVAASLNWKLALQIHFLIILTIIVILMLVFIWSFAAVSLKGFWSLLIIVIWLSAIIVFSSSHKIPLRHFLPEFGGFVAKTYGFIRGARNRRRIEQKRNPSIKGTIFILAGVPIDDTGGGARCTQIALELLRQKYAVVYINKFPKYETVNLNLSIKDAYLFTYPASEFNWSKLTRDLGWLLEKNVIGALVEMPLSDFIPTIYQVRESGGVVAYDLLDDWNSQLGGDWYSEDIEAEIIKSSQILLATAPILAERLSRMSDKRVEILPNAVNTHLFNPDHYYERPYDLPRSDWSAIYIGALWGEWFDWDLLVEVARKYTEASVIVIGDYKGQCPVKLPNLHFLGLKRQSFIPAYLAHSDVAIIPWKVNKITQATSPLKVYEYLAMRKPVISLEINPLKGIPGVYLAQDRSDFIDKIEEARKTTLPIESISHFVAENNWQARINRLLHLIQTAPK